MIFCSALGKCSDDASNPDCMPSIFSHNKATPLAKLHSTAMRQHHHKLLKKKKREKASLEALKKPLKYPNESRHQMKGLIWLLMKVHHYCLIRK